MPAVFNKGLVTRLEPHLIPQEASIIYENIDNDSAILRPILEPFSKVLLNTNYAVYYITEDRWQGFADYVDCVEYNNRLFATDGINKPTVAYKNDTYNLYLQQTSAYTLRKSTSESAGEEQIEYTYAVTVFDENTNYESIPVTQKITKEAIVANKGVNLDLFTNIDSQATHLKIYRLGGDISTFLLVEQVPISATDSIIVDDIPDTELEGSAMDLDLFNQADTTGFKYLTEFRGRFYAAKGDRLYYTEPGEPTIWVRLNFITSSREITGVGKTSQGILIFTASTSSVLIEIIQGDGGYLFQLTQLSDDKGCIGQASVQSYGPNCVWVSEFGICLSNGYDVSLVTREELGRLSLEFNSSIVAYDQYMLNLTDGRIFIIDFIREVAKHERYEADFIVLENNKPHIIKSRTVQTLYAGRDLLPMHYKSGNMVGNSILERKVYSSVHLTFKGSINFRVNIDDRNVYSELLETEQIKNETIKIGSDYSRGMYINYEVTGVGTVYGIYEEYSA